MMRRRGGPGILSTVARTAVIAGTATAVSNSVNTRAAADARARQEHVAAQPAPGELEQVKAQLAGLQAQELDAAAHAGPGAMMAHLQQLAQLRESGMLNDEEFTAAKAKLLAG